MRLYRLLLLSALIAGVLLLARLPVPTQAHDHEQQELTDDLRTLVHDVREATAQYHDLDVALEAGYGKFLDCFKHGEDMGMGQHYVNGELAGDDVLDATKPEALVYEPLEDGTMIPVAFEYLVFADVWDPEDTGREAPTLFGQEFSLKTNIPDTPPVWALHIWLWSHNPEGLFADFNPLIACPAGEPSVDLSTMS
jgi:hypothetical protein